MNYVKDKKSYIEWEKLDQIYRILNPTLKKDKKRFDPHLINIAKSEPDGDLTDVHPNDRENLEVFKLEIFDMNRETSPVIIELLEGVHEIVKNMIGLHDSSFFIHAPNMWIPPHVHDTSKPEYYDSTNYNIYLPLVIPPGDTKKVGARIGKYIYPLIEGDALVFDHQIPHDSWNYTDQWCIGMLFNIQKQYFTDIPYENYHP
jgi:hypothetical protein